MQDENVRLVGRVPVVPRSDPGGMYSVYVRGLRLLIKRPTNVLRVGKVMGASDCSGSLRSLLLFVRTAAAAAIAGARHAARTIVESKVHD